MHPGRKLKPTALKRANGNPGKRPLNLAEPIPPEGLPDCPDHLSDSARAEWHRLAAVLHGMGIFTTVDRAALALADAVRQRRLHADHGQMSRQKVVTAAEEEQHCVLPNPAPLPVRAEKAVPENLQFLSHQNPVATVIRTGKRNIRSAMPFNKTAFTV